jgi:hypothetical protein
LGKASRRKRDRRAHPTSAPAWGTVEAASQPGTLDGWSASTSAHRCVRLLDELAGPPHPCLLTVLMNALDQYLDDVAELDPDADPGIGWASLGSGLSPEQWRTELRRLGEQISHIRYGDTAAHRTLITRMHTLLPHGKSYPRHAEAYVISPEMHNVVRAASLTVTPDDQFTLDPNSALPTPAGLLLLPRVRVRRWRLRADLGHRVAPRIWPRGTGRTAAVGGVGRGAVPTNRYRPAAPVGVRREGFPRGERPTSAHVAAVPQLATARRGDRGPRTRCAPAVEQPEPDGPGTEDQRHRRVRPRP